MDIRTFFLLALQAGAYKRRSWVLSLFSVFKPKENADTPYLVRRDPQGCYYLDPESGEAVRLEGSDASLPLLSPMDALTLTSGELANVSEKVATTYGNALVNMQLLIDPFGDMIPFQTGKVSLKKIESVLADKGTRGELDIDAYLRFCNNVAALSGYTQVTVPAASAQSLTGHPDRFKLRERLLEEYADRLDEPAVIATIDAELEKLDRQWIADSPSAGFYTSDKSFAIVRKRLYYMLGAEQQKDSTKLHLNASSLAEGINYEDLPSMLTTQRLGSYNRGSNTALGGESVKFYLRAFQNVAIGEEDCGSTLTVDYPVTQSNWKEYVGFYTLNSSKKRVLIDEALAKGAIGSTIAMRSPLYCHTKGSDLCVTCMGDLSRNAPKSLGELAAAVGSQHMGAFMGAVHGSALKLAEYHPETSLS